MQSNLWYLCPLKSSLLLLFVSANSSGRFQKFNLKPTLHFFVSFGFGPRQVTAAVSVAEYFQKVQNFLKQCCLCRPLCYSIPVHAHFCVTKDVLTSGRPSKGFHRVPTTLTQNKRYLYQYLRKMKHKRQHIKCYCIFVPWDSWRSVRRAFCSSSLVKMKNVLLNDVCLLNSKANQLQNLSLGISILCILTYLSKLFLQWYWYIH